jgi:tetratricopeptide (TPR) repeat protein
VRLRASLALVATLALFAPKVAEAQTPTIWERAADTSVPTRAELDFVHRRVTELYQQADDAGPVGGTHGAMAISSLNGARDLLVRFGAATSPDVRLRFDLARVLVRLNEFTAAIPVLTAALTLAPSDPRAEDAWFSLAICHAHLGQREAEVKEYLTALTLTDDPDMESTLLANLAEARMGLGELDLAIEAAEGSLEIYDSVLTRWTLAVIRDRAGDPYGALTDAKIAISLDPNYMRLDGPGVFFEPEYEVHWYRALGDLAHAATDDKDDKLQRELRLMSALHELDRFVAAAPPSDRYRELAKTRMESIERELKLSAPPKPPPLPKKK